MRDTAAQDGVELLQIEKAVDAMHELQFSNEGGWMQHIRSDAADHLAHHIIENCAVYRRIEPSRDEMPIVRHRFTVGVQRNKDKLLTMEAQLEDARRRGMCEAADLLSKNLAILDTVSGPCAHVLRHQLSECISTIRKAAT